MTRLDVQVLSVVLGLLLIVGIALVAIACPEWSPYELRLGHLLNCP